MKRLPFCFQWNDNWHWKSFPLASNFDFWQNLVLGKRTWVAESWTRNFPEWQPNLHRITLSLFNASVVGTKPFGIHCAKLSAEFDPPRKTESWLEHHYDNFFDDQCVLALYSFVSRLRFFPGSGGASHCFMQGLTPIFLQSGFSADLEWTKSFVHLSSIPFIDIACYGQRAGFQKTTFLKELETFLTPYFPTYFYVVVNPISNLLWKH